MALVTVERLDHLGLIAEVIKDLGLIGMIDARLVPDEQEVLTPGEAVAGMILNGLGFSNRPLSLTPQFFANKPLDLLFREGVHAELFNRFKLGRTLEEISVYGCDLLLSELALAVCGQEGSDQRFNHLDTTSCSLTGDYVPASDEQAITMTHGYAKDHRPDLKQAVLELMVAQDGGVPLVSKSWDGNTSDTQIFQGRAKALLATFQHSPTPRYVVADAKLYNEDNATTLKTLGFITRIPNTLKLVVQVITPVLRWDTWHRLDDTTRYQRIEWCHYGMAQRWLVVSSQGALERAEASITKACQREAEAIDKQLFHLQARRFETPRGRASRAGHAGESMEVSPGWLLQTDRTQTLCQQRSSDAYQPDQVYCLADASPGPAGSRADSVLQGMQSLLRGGDQYCAEPAERSGGDAGLQRPSPGRRRLAVSQRPAVFCLVVVCEKTLSDSRAAHGDDLSIAGLCRDATPTAPTPGTPNRDRAEPDQPTDGAANLALGLPAPRRDSPRPRDRARPGARPD